MKLDSLYELDEQKIKDTLDIDYSKYNNFRCEGYRYKVIDNDIHIIGYQYTKIKKLNFSLNIHIFLKVILDSELNIKYINLFDDFKGSQGSKCNRDKLNNHINEIFINEKLTLKNPKFKDYKLSYCRHIYELLYGMCDYNEYNINNNIKDSFYYEKTDIDIGLLSINFNTLINLNNNIHNYKLNINNIISTKLDKDYKISSCNLKLLTLLDKENILEENIKCENNISFYQKLLKYIFKDWNIINDKLNLNNMFSFTYLFPTSLYSFIVQILTVYKRIYDKEALNKCLVNFQIVNGEAMCLGFEGDKNDI